LKVNEIQSGEKKFHGYNNVVKKVKTVSSYFSHTPVYNMVLSDKTFPTGSLEVLSSLYKSFFLNGALV
jgi:hypothetical protein